MPFADKDAFNNSLKTVLGEMESAYSIQNVEYNYSSADPSAVWLIHTQSMSGVITYIKKQLPVADAYDFKWYTKYVDEIFKNTENWESYKIYRDERPLGADTICETSLCSIFILASDDNPNLYIGISRH